MPSISKRRLLQASAISIAHRLIPPAWAAREPDSGSARKVVIVTFGGGVRYSETFSPEGARNIPRLTEMRPKGFFYRNCVNAGVLSHFNSTASIVTGNWQRVDDFGVEPPAGPTLFESFRKQTGARPLDAWVIATNKSFATMGCGSDRALGQPYGANVVLPKQLLLEAVRDVTRRPSRQGLANRENVLERLEGILNEGYEGVGWTIFKAGRELDRHVRETLVRTLAEYVHGPEAPSSGDELTYFIAREVMREFSPRLILVNFWDMDVAHWGSFSLYLQAIGRTDRLTGMLWDEIQTNPAYRGKTTLLVLPELGRDGDANTANGFLNHRSGDPSCRAVWLLAAGSGVAAGETERPVRHVDVAATAAGILGVKPAGMAGTPLIELS